MSRIIVKNEREIQGIRESCRIVAEVLKLLKDAIKPGVLTIELDLLAEDYIRSRNAIPAFKGYCFEPHNPYPACLCISIDDEVVHGIPKKRELREGEIVSIDVGVKKNDFYGDGAWTFQVGKVSDEKLRLMKVTEESLYLGINEVHVNKRVGDISAAIQTHVERAGFSVVRDLAGHGVGCFLHEEPMIPNYGKAGTGPLLRKGFTLAIEPMVNTGTHEVCITLDGWTVKTSDGLPSAHFEHTVLITENAPEILTAVV